VICASCNFIFDGLYSILFACRAADIKKHQDEEEFVDGFVDFSSPIKSRGGEESGLIRASSTLNVQGAGRSGAL
jgi:hypothetical protein